MIVVAFRTSRQYVHRSTQSTSTLAHVSCVASSAGFSKGEAGLQMTPKAFRAGDLTY